MPASAANAARVIEIKALPNRFDPATVDVKAGETVTFRIVNTDNTFHEFMIADEKTHEARDKEMAAMGSEPMAMSDKPNTITVPAGQTEALTWMFTKAGKVIFADHNPGRYDAGMRGFIVVSP